MRNNTLLILAALLLAGGAARAQEGPWSLKDCIRHALDHNLTVQQSALTVEQREVELSTAQARRLPGVSASASENLSFGRGLTEDNTYSNANTTSTSFSLSGNVPVFQGFDITNGIKLSKLNLAAATSDLEKARDDIRVSVAQAYVQILYNQELLRVAREQTAHDADLLEQIRELTRTLGLEDRVRLPGFVTDVIEAYHAGDLCVPASRSEGLPFNLMEAMACALPGVASRVKGHEDLIEPGQTGLLYDYDDQTAFCRAVTALMEDPWARERMGRAARQTVLSRYGLEQAAAVYLELMDPTAKGART